MPGYQEPPRPAAVVIVPSELTRRTLFRLASATRYPPSEVAETPFAAPISASRAGPPSPTSGGCSLEIQHGAQGVGGRRPATRVTTPSGPIRRTPQPECSPSRIPPSGASARSTEPTSPESRAGPPSRSIPLFVPPITRLSRPRSVTCQTTEYELTSTVPSGRTATSIAPSEALVARIPSRAKGIPPPAMVKTRSSCAPAAGASIASITSTATGNLMTMRSSSAYRSAIASAAAAGRALGAAARG